MENKGQYPNEVKINYPIYKIYQQKLIDLILILGFNFTYSKNFWKESDIRQIY